MTQIYVSKDGKQFERLADCEQHEYELAVEVLRPKLPKELFDWAIAEAYDRGHSAGYGKVLMHLERFVQELQPIAEDCV